MHVGGFLGTADGKNVSQGDESRRIGQSHKTGQRKKLTIMQWGRREVAGGRVLELDGTKARGSDLGVCSSISQSLDLSCPNPSRYPLPARCLSGTNCKPWRGSHSKQGGVGVEDKNPLKEPGQHIIGSTTLIIIEYWYHWIAKF